MIGKMFIPVVLLVPFLFSGCSGSDHEALAEDMLDSLDEMLNLLSTVKDEASANKAAPEIEKVSKKLQEQLKEAEKLGEPAEEMNEDLKKRSKEMWGKLMQEMMRVGMIAGDNEQIMKALEAMDPSK